ncbi:MAG: SDR family oxidoreductase [Burkholderiales bacterium]|nr:SDR family oxidoreductase [Burkholderiales bacterium]
MDLGIAGRVAIVSGASGGLGRAVALRLAGEGCRVVLCARTRARLDAVAAELREASGTQPLVVTGDATDAGDVDRLHAEVARVFGGADILVLNTGRPPLPMRDVLEETSDERWEAAHRTQLRPVILLTRRFVPDLVAKGWGRVVGITSASVQQPMPHHALSTVYRAGVTALLKHLANEVAATGVTVNMVCPASVATDGLVASYDPEARKATVPMRRLGRPEELAAAVAFLASDLAGYTTGASLQVDGGMVAALV